MKIIIPARRGSEGLPLKNRMLFLYTANLLKIYSKNVIVSSDDKEIKKESRHHGFSFHERSRCSASSKASPKEFMEEIINDCNIDKDEIIMILYLTYPERNVADIDGAWDFFTKHNSDSMLCAKKVSVSPYMMAVKCGAKGRQVIKHNYYRRQDYPECFEISHFICIFKVGELPNLNNNLYNKNTIFYPIRDIIDIDTKEDLDAYKYNR